MNISCNLSEFIKIHLAYKMYKRLLFQTQANISTKIKQRIKGKY